MKLIRDAQVLIGSLESGQLLADLSNKVMETLAELKNQSGPKRTVRGSVTLKLNFAVEDAKVTIENEISNKVPARPRSSDFFWVTDDGALSTQHPKQLDMGFDGPRAVPARSGE